MTNNKSNSEFAKDTKLNDADIVTDILGSNKSLVKMYSTALTEVDCENLRTILKTQMSECADDQYDAFLYMNERGIYPTEDAPKPKIKDAINHFKSMANWAK